MTTEERLARIEGHNRLMMAGLALVAIWVAAGFVLDLAARNVVPDVVKAGAFFVMGSNGVAQVALTATEEGGSVATSNNEGETLVSLMATEDGGVVMTRTNEGEGLVSLMANDHGGAILTLNGKGEMRVGIGATHAGGMVRTSNGEEDLVGIKVAEDGTGMVEVRDPAGKLRDGKLTPQP